MLQLPDQRHRSPSEKALRTNDQRPNDICHRSGVYRKGPITFAETRAAECGAVPVCPRNNRIFAARRNVPHLSHNKSPPLKQDSELEINQRRQTCKKTPGEPVSSPNKQNADCDLIPGSTMPFQDLVPTPPDIYRPPSCTDSCENEN